MIVKPGKVTITPTEIQIDGFEFKDGNMAIWQIEAMFWAMKQLSTIQGIKYEEGQA